MAAIRKSDVRAPIKARLDAAKAAQQAEAKKAAIQDFKDREPQS